jgi:hypothetical protein
MQRAREGMIASQAIFVREFFLVELSGLEPLTPACKATYTPVVAALTWPDSCPWVTVRYRYGPC